MNYGMPGRTRTKAWANADDAEVKAWLKTLDPAMLPVKR